jgi:integrase/recombinase XerD
MIENIFVFEGTRSRQREAPKLKEREQYLSFMLDQGVSKPSVRMIASMLLHIVQFMELSCLRNVDMTEIQQGSQRWIADSRRLGETSVASFTHTALNWLRFHKVLDIATAPAVAAAVIVEEFVQFMTVTKGMAPQSIRSYCSRVALFLRWAMARHEQLSAISLSDVDDFFESHRGVGYRPRTISSFCSALRLFFR